MSAQHPRTAMLVGGEELAGEGAGDPVVNPAT